MKLLLFFEKISLACLLATITSCASKKVPLEQLDQSWMSITYLTRVDLLSVVAEDILIETQALFEETRRPDPPIISFFGISEKEEEFLIEQFQDRIPLMRSHKLITKSGTRYVDSETSLPARVYWPQITSFDGDKASLTLYGSYATYYQLERFEGNWQIENKMRPIP